MYIRRTFKKNYNHKSSYLFQQKVKTTKNNNNIKIRKKQQTKH